MIEKLVLSAITHKRGKPDTLEIEVAGRQPISADQDPATGDMVYRNRTWIVVEGLELGRVSHIFEGGILIMGKSGKQELEAVTVERWRREVLVQAKALDPRPVSQRSRQFAAVGR